MQHALELQSPILNQGYCVTQVSGSAKGEAHDTFEWVEIRRNGNCLEHVELLRFVNVHVHQQELITGFVAGWRRIVNERLLGFICGEIHDECSWELLASLNTPVFFCLSILVVARV